ncbi:SMI1/KNR4 family protein [Cyanobacterium aponinum AL20118]|uniref:SMI1/KNR4 family protein n=1 Tax=Cyanobacterium aponinum AL20115 TaxID=3090662 RepID=A0AAF1C4I2_9CHRO|nr:SMI1/KNR4 family protein [Cyanobacterium aponinum]PHV62259.1 SMI1/KNR4 family protein [Cyanobacterium aponinum IPPAS B-1201]WPF87025.1 SMI1/KNR4 family protein [Cyanobacterium aponinum AL20115]
MNWLDFLEKWSQEALEILSPLQKEENISSLTESELEFLTTKTLLKPPATPSQIENLENRLRKKLPPSYKDFLRTSNGWIQLAMDAEDGILWSTEEVDWLIKQEPELVETWHNGRDNYVSDEKYFVYGKEQDCIDVRTEYLCSALALSPLIDSAIYLLNPQVVTNDGEWEAWFFGNELPGANRYPSFAQMMIAEKERVLYSLKDSCDYRY